jgi:hypothetical protein
MVILYEKCDPEVAKDKSLPRDSFLVTYMNDNEVCYDVVRSGNQVEVFDHYHDKSCTVKSIKWTEGNVHPKMYGYVPRETKKKKR